MNHPLAYILPLTCALFYALAAILTKRAIDNGLGPWRITVLNAWVIALVNLPFLLLPGIAWSEIVWPRVVLLAVLALGGAVTTFLAFSRGDVSVAAPLMGTKAIWVAVFTVVLLRESVPAIWWLAAGLSTIGVVFLRGQSVNRSQLSLSATIAYALTSALLFAVSDVIIQKSVGPERFTREIPLMFVLAALLSLGFVKMFRASVWEVPRPVWKFLAPGVVLMSLQGTAFTWTISRFGHATAMNILYSSRGIWSVVIVWFAGQWLAGEEGTTGHRVMASRLVGASLLLIAVVLVMI